MTKKIVLPDLPYAYDALEPILSKEIMQIHHQKHHLAYVNNFNQAAEKYAAAEAQEDLATMIALQPALRFNGGGHLNHSLFWTNLAPPSLGGGAPPQGPLAKALQEQWGSCETFVDQFVAAAVAVQGSGWCWLGACPHSKVLLLKTCPNQDPLFATHGLIPLLGVDVWEHAYYLQYKNARLDYLKAIWKVIDWAEVGKRYASFLSTSLPQGNSVVAPRR